MQDMSPVKVTFRLHEMGLAIQTLSLVGNDAHPADFRAVYIRDRQPGALFSELFGHGFDVNVEIVAEEIANLCVLVVADQGESSLGIGRVDVDICGTVAMRAPTGLRPSRNNFGVLV